MTTLAAGGGGMLDGAGDAHSPRGSTLLSLSTMNRSEPIRWRNYQAVVRLSQVIHLIADAISDWDNIVDSFEQLVIYFTAYKAPPTSPIPAPSNATRSTSSTTNGANTAAGDPGNSANGGTSDKELTLQEIEKIFGAIERFKVYSVYLSDDALVRLMTSLVALSMNHLAVTATSSSSADANGGQDASNSTSNNSNNHNNQDIIQVTSATFATSTGGVGGSGGGGAVGTIFLNRVRPESSSAGLAYMTEGIRNGTISFSLQALIEITKLNSFRISTVWQMVISHLRMIASLKVQMYCVLQALFLVNEI